MGLARRHALVLIVIVGGILRFAWLGGQSFWYDEWGTVTDVQLGFGDMLRGLDAHQATPPLYFIAASGWGKLFGDSEVALRSLSAVLGTATIPLLYATARTLATHRAGLITAALGAVNPLLIWYSQEARSYSLLVFLSALSFLFLVHALRDDRPLWLIGWAAASSLAVTTHYVSMALIIPEAVWLLLRGRRDRVESIAAIAGVGAIVVALAPLIADQVAQVGWIQYLDLGGRLAEVPQHFLVGLTTPSALLPLLAAAIFCAAILGVLALGRPAERQAIFVSGSIGLGGLVVVLLGGLLEHDYLISRNLLALWVPFTVAAGVALAAAGAPRLRLAGLAALCGISLGLAVWSALTPTSQRTDWRGVADALGPPEVTRLVLVPGADYLANPLKLYLDGSRDAGPQENSIQEVVLIGSESGGDYAIGDCWWGMSCGDPEDQPEETVPKGFALTETGSTDTMDYRIYRASTPAMSVPVPGAGSGSALVQPPD